MSARPLAGQVAVVTGGGRGVGRGIVEALASAGMSIAVLGRSARHAEDAAAAARDRGAASALALPADVTDRAAVEDAVREILESLGAIDLLVNNAGRAHAVGPVWEVDPDDWWADVEVNLRGTYLCARSVLPSMIERASGRIVNVASLAANGPFPYASAYSGSKAAVLNFTESLASSAGPHGVCGFVISPGLVRTSLLDDLANSEQGRRWLPEFQARPERDYVAPAVAGRLIEQIATGVADALSGRFIHVSDDLAELVARAETVTGRDERVLRMTL
jgi:NAD(P)-dependent dehydrogenase (short-subunit alcohol dehydrogenase family)